MDNERGVATLCPTAYQREKDSVCLSVLLSCFCKKERARRVEPRDADNGANVELKIEE